MVVIEERFSEAERKHMLKLAMDAVPKDHAPDKVLFGIIAKLTGTDTVVLVRRAYQSRQQSPL